MLPSCVPPQQSGERRQSSVAPPPRAVSARHVTSALWHVAVLNHRAIIWCQVVQRPQASVMVLPRYCPVATSPRQHAAARRHFTLFPQLHSSPLSAVARHPSAIELCICIVFHARCLGWPPNVSSTEKGKYNTNMLCITMVTYYIREDNIQKPIGAFFFGVNSEGRHFIPKYSNN